MDPVLVLVHWMDITGMDEPWGELKDAEELTPAYVTTAGWIVVEEEEYIVIASTTGTEGEMGNLNCIPKGVVKWLKKIEAGEEEEDDQH
mgnify:CR=1 FL=1|tara:strand:- start:400 stop:666 length:267 start_codon:yes stop_codon:yes gene_type:complete